MRQIMIQIIQALYAWVLKTSESFEHQDFSKGYIQSFGAGSALWDLRLGVSKTYGGFWLMTEDKGFPK